MKRSNICFKWLFALSLGLLYSCEEGVEITLGEGLADEIVFEGNILNLAPPYFFRLTHPSHIQMLEWPEEPVYNNIEDAEVIVTDVTAGVRDTLVRPVYKSGRFGNYKYLSYYNYHRKEQMDINCSEHLGGIYVTTKIYGVEGHTYILDINYKGKHYTSTETMIPGTPITDLKVKEVDLGVKGTSYAPCISFVNRPNEDNYYLLYYQGGTINSLKDFGGLYPIDTIWSIFFSILSDEHLEENVTDFIVKEGETASHNRLPGIQYIQKGDSLYVHMMSLSKQCYDAYSQMIEQIRTDGGAYTPRPTNIRGNISGGAWGCFRVSAVTEKGIYIGAR